VWDKTDPRLEEFGKWILAGKNLLIEELWDAPKALLLAKVRQLAKKNVVLITGKDHENRLLGDFPFFEDQEVIEFLSLESLPEEEEGHNPDITGQRYQVLHTLQDTKEPRIVLTSLQAALQKLAPPKDLKSLYLTIAKGQKITFGDLPYYLTEIGYEKCSVASDKGEFAMRGGIIDIFPVSSTDPFRLEFEEDSVESIRKYDPVSQISIEKVESILITPANEKELFQEGSRGSLFDYLGPQTVVVFDDLLALEDKYVSLKPILETSKAYYTLQELLKITSSFQKLYLTDSPLEELSEVRFLDKSGSNAYAEGAPPRLISFQAFGEELLAERWRHPFLPLLPSFCPPEIKLEEFSTEEFLKALLSCPFPIYLLSASEAEELHFREKIRYLEPSSTKKLFFERGYLSSGFLLKDSSSILLPMTELTHRYRIHRQKQRSHYHALPVESLSIAPGESIVHMNNGIGRFLSIEKRPNHLGIETEYMLVEYAGGSTLYVPMEQAHLVSKYIGSGDETPKLNTLGDAYWKRTRERTEKAIMGYAKDLLQLHAERALKGGFVYPPDGDLVKQFRDEFPYEETADQTLAIEKICEDMLSTRSMDRLICGDVGFGKTEVAMRAAFKAVVDGGKQVAVLVPTTVLAMQHFDTFSERMSSFAIKVGLLSRFCTPKQIKETIAGIEKGSIDMVIGTHRLISKDIIFKDLGLIIIDEEQRFGVKAKEHLKQLKKEVDCLTLSATPIPRTLYMSLVGAKDMSVINTPPADRLPVHTVVSHGSDEVIKNALLRELTRDGQAYFIHNRVETIFQVADRLRTLLPEARILVAHGQMDADELDRVFHTYKSGKADILIATSIIENGIDIPNANTILVDRADRFGLADLYQIRGRVGRWNRKAYCYFLVPNMRELSEIARKRLTALVQGGHGGGMKIAMHDLELRGAGNILGTEQSGHVTAIGFHLYCKLLKKTILSLQKKGTISLQTDVKIEFPFDARLPEDYINEISLRMEFYQRLGEADNEHEISMIVDELKDRFGPLPPAAEWLYHIARIRLFASEHKFTLLKLTKVVFLAEQAPGDKKEKISKKMLVQLPKNPREVEVYLIDLLKKNFPMRL